MTIPCVQAAHHLALLEGRTEKAWQRHNMRRADAARLRERVGDLRREKLAFAGQLRACARRVAAARGHLASLLYATASASEARDKVWCYPSRHKSPVDALMFSGFQH